MKVWGLKLEEQKNIDRWEHEQTPHPSTHSPPMTGRLVFSDRDTTVANWAGHRTSMSIKPLWGATTSTGASFRSARWPLTFTQKNPREVKTDRLSSQMMGCKSQRRQPVTGRERCSGDRPANRSRARGHATRKKREARAVRSGKRTLPRMMPCGSGERGRGQRGGVEDLQQNNNLFKVTTPRTVSQKNVAAEAFWYYEP